MPIAAGQELERNRTRSLAAGWQLDPGGGLREGDVPGEFPADRDQEHALAHLWHAVQSGVEERVAADIAAAYEDLADLAGNVVVAMVQHIRQVFHDHGERRARLDAIEVLDVEPCPYVVPEGFRVVRHLAQLGPPDER